MDNVYGSKYRLFKAIVTILLAALIIPSGVMAFPADFDGDGKSDLVVWRPTGPDQGKWFVIPSTGSCPAAMCTPQTAPCTPYYSGGCVFQWGLTGDDPLSGDFDADGKSDFVVRRISGTQSNWYFYYSSGSAAGPVPFGQHYPMSPADPNNFFDEADINGDGRSDLMYMLPPYAPFSTYNSTQLVVRYYTPALGVYTVAYPSSPFGIASSSTTTSPFIFPGNHIGTLPNPEPGIFVIATVNQFTGDYSLKWTSINTDSGSNLPFGTFTLQVNTANQPFPIAVQGNFGGTVANRDDFVHWRPSNATWTPFFNAGGPGSGVSTAWGLTGDIPISGNFDSDSLHDFMVWRPSDGTWYLKPSSGTCPKSFCPPSYNATCPPYWYGGCKRQWGLSSDLPVS